MKAKPPQSQTKIHNVLIEILSPESKDKVELRGSLVHIPGARTLPFSGFSVDKNYPVIGFLSFPEGDLAFLEPKPPGRPSKSHRDVAVYLAHMLFKLSDSNLTEVDLRRLVVKAWAGKLPDEGFRKAYQGIKESKHVKRIMSKAAEAFPELTAPLRTMENLPLFRTDETAKGALFLIEDDTLYFIPSVEGKKGRPGTNGGIQGQFFDDVSVWMWPIGEEYASPVRRTVWRPDFGVMFIQPVKRLQPFRARTVAQ